MPPKLRLRSFKLKLFWSFNENLGLFITQLLGFYISVLILCPHVNFLCCAYMTNLFIQKVKVTENKHLTQKHYVSSSLRVFVQNLFTMFFNVNMRMFCFSFYMTDFLNCVQSGGQGHRKKVGQNASLRLIVPLVSFGTPWPNKQNHKTLHFQNFLNEKFIAASIKITVFKIKSHFTEYSSVILSLSIILTEICMFSKIFKQMHIIQKQFAYFQHAFYIQLNVDTQFIVVLNCC